MFVNTQLSIFKLFQSKPLKICFIFDIIHLKKGEQYEYNC
nr:MAG TPA: hypothetical protein [Caudoviricetes sp.]